MARLRFGLGALARPVLKLIVLAGLLWSTTLSCGAGQDSLLVFAAASLTDALQQIGNDFEASQGTKVNFSFGASSSLARQIERGAPADLFIAAGEAPVDLLEDKGLLSEGMRRDLLSNSLVIVVPSSGGPVISSVQNLLQGDYRIAIGNPDLAPAGQYARQALMNLGMWEALQGRLVYGTNVRTALGYVESGDAGAALVYATDAAITSRVRVAATLPTDSHSPITYPVVQLARSPRKETGQRLMDYLASEEAAAIFATYGFQPVLVRP